MNIKAFIFLIVYTFKNNQDECNDCLWISLRSDTKRLCSLESVVPFSPEYSEPRTNKSVCVP